MNPHKSYLVVRDFLIDMGGFKLIDPVEGAKVMGEVELRFDTDSRVYPSRTSRSRSTGRRSTPVRPCPGGIVYDSTEYADGPLYVDVTGRVDTVGLELNQSVRLSIANSWTLIDPLAAPAPTWFGTINEEAGVQIGRLALRPGRPRSVFP